MASEAPSVVLNSKKRSRWWSYYHEGSGADVLELQPLHDHGSKNNTKEQNPHHTRYTTTDTAAATATEARTLERVLGLDEPILLLRNSINEQAACFVVGTSCCSRQYFFPLDLPRAIQLWRFENISIPACYLTVGIMQGMIRPLLNVYPLALGATEAQQTTLASIATLPSALKIVFGFLSDNIPIFGYRRKPYMLAGWLLTSASLSILLHSFDLSLTAVDTTNSKAVDNKPSMESLMLVFFVVGCGIWLSDVMADSFVAQKAKLEPSHAHGNMQSTCYACRFFGLAAAAPLSTYLYSVDSHGPATVVTILLATPWVVVLPFLYVLAEERDAHIPSTNDQCREIWKTVCSRAVWQPIGFIYLFNLLQVPNAAWRQFLTSVLDFSSSQLNILLTASYFLLFVGTVAYKAFFLKTSWRHLYRACILISGILSLGQLALIRGFTAGLSPFLFALGDDALSECIVGLQMLPVAMLMVRLCPMHSEGASYAMFTTAWNSAMLLAQALGSSALLGIWDVSKETMVAGNVDGLFKLSVLTTLIQLSPIFLVGWLPHGREDLDELANEDDHRNRSTVGGAIFLCIVLSSVLYTMMVAVLNIVSPGWAGES